MLRRKALVIINPVSGKRASGKHLERLRECLDEAGIEFELRETTGDGDAMRWARDATDVDMVIALGGDGTIMEAMSGLIESGSQIPLAQIPAGTANLLARALRIPTDLEGALEVVLSGVPIRHDVGQLEGSGRYFALVAGAGFDAQLIEDTPRALKNRMGFLAYVLAGIKNVFKLHRSHVILEVDGEQHYFRAHTVMVINIGGISGIQLKGISAISPHDGKLDVAVVTPATLVGLVEVAWRLVTGRLSGYERLKFMQAERVKIEANPAMDVEIDGETLGTTPLSLRSVPDGALFLVPEAYVQEHGLTPVEVERPTQPQVV